MLNSSYKLCISRIYYLNFIGNTIRKCLNSQIQGMQRKYRQRAANKWRKESFLYRNKKKTQKNTNSATVSILGSQTLPQYGSNHSTKMW